MNFKVSPRQFGSGTVSVPGDKSISHRALMLGSIGSGRTEVSGFLSGDDCLATAAAMRALGVRIEQTSPVDLVIDGVGLQGMRPPLAPLDLGNSGTAMRLMAGLLSGQTFDSVLTGDTSLSGRPMNRIIKPLTLMGAAIEADSGGKPPLKIKGGRRLQGIHYAMPVASAQVKSAILLAGLFAEGTTSVTEPAVTRDHTERMLRAMGVEVTREAATVSLQGGQEPSGCHIVVPGDLSSATFIILGTILSQNSDITITNVGTNPTRTGVIDILLAMGADIRLLNRRTFGDEPVADIRVRSSRLAGCDVDPALAPLAIDEFPALFVAAAAAEGETRFSGLEELRVKESDRIAAMTDGLRRLGVVVEEAADGAVIRGGVFQGGVVESYHDHRVAMSLAMAGTIAQDEVVVRDVDNVNTSFPGFCDLVTGLGADVRLA